MYTHTCVKANKWLHVVTEQPYSWLIQAFSCASQQVLHIKKKSNQSCITSPTHFVRLRAPPRPKSKGILRIPVIPGRIPQLPESARRHTAREYYLQWFFLLPVPEDAGSWYTKGGADRGRGERVWRSLGLVQRFSW